MADITIKKTHSQDVAVIRGRLEELAQKMTEKFGVKVKWNGDTCELSGGPIKKGTVAVTADSVTMELTLGLLGKALKGTIEKESEARIERLLA